MLLKLLQKCVNLVDMSRDRANYERVSRATSTLRSARRISCHLIATNQQVWWKDRRVRLEGSEEKQRYVMRAYKIAIMRVCTRLRFFSFQRLAE